MKKTRILSTVAGLTLLLCATAVRLAAQDDPAPKEPLVPRAPDTSTWTITYRYKVASATPRPDANPSQKPPDQITSIRVQKAGKVYHRVTNWSSGAQSDAWTVGQRQVVKHKTTPTYALMPSEGPETDDYSKSDFEDLTWITMKYFDGYKKGEQSVFTFKVKNVERPMTRQDKYKLAFLGLLASAPNPKTSPKPGEASAPKLDAKAVLEQIYGDTVATVVLDAGTQLPVAYDDGKIILVYQFEPTPASTLTPPPEVVTILKRFDDYAKGNTLRPSSP